MLPITQIHWYKLHQLLYWNAAELNSPTDLMMSNTVIIDFLQDAQDSPVNILMDWRDVRGDDLLVILSSMKQYFTFVQKSNVNALIVYNVYDHAYVANIGRFANQIGLPLHCVDTLDEALALLDYAVS